MADRTFYRDPETGRFISAERASELDRAIRVDFRGGFREETELRQGFEDEQEQEQYEPYEMESSKWGARIVVDDSDLTRLQAMDFPEGATGFRVTYHKPPGQPGESGYRGQITGGWLGASEWPPTLAQGPTSDVTGISFIVFDMGN